MNMLKDYFEDELSVKEAKEEAQKLTFYPMMFQAARVMRNSGMLEVLHKRKRAGITSQDLASEVGLPYYGVNSLLEVGLTVGLVHLLEEGIYTISKMGYFLLRDEATRVNLNFTHDVCYKALFHLEECIKTESAVGLKEIGLEGEPTIYPHLSKLPEPIKTSWFDFDHYYSDQAFPQALKIVFKDKPAKIADIGGNTGKWSIACCGHDEDVNMVIVDLPGQWARAKGNIESLGLEHRITGIEQDVLQGGMTLPSDIEAVWMSQFLDCFSEEQITNILTNIKNTISDDASVYIMELFWDRQKDLAAAYCLHGTTLYFTAVANGNSKMYHSRDMYKMIEAAGMEVVGDHDEVGEFHTILQCRKKK